MFTSALCRQIGIELEEAATAIANKYGVVAKRQGGNFNSAAFVAKVEFSSPALKEVEAKNNFALLAGCYGMQPDWLGKSVRIGGKVYTIVDINAGRPKYPVVVERDGKLFKVTPDDVIRGMRQAGANV